MSDTYLTLVFGTEVAPAQGGVSQLQTDLAVLVADGASPTQAHVVSVANDVSLMMGGNATNTSGVGATQAALLMVIDTTVVSTVSTLNALFQRALSQARASGLAP